MTQILIYHALDSDARPVELEDAADMSVVVRASVFAEQMQRLKESGRRVLSLPDMLRGRGRGGNDDVVLTFDDGHASNLHLALPVLQEFGFSATFYIVSGFIDSKTGYLTTDQLKQLAAAGMHIGSHTVTHRWLPLISRDEVRRELYASKDQLETTLDQPVTDFAFPGGHFRTWMLDEARRAGYRSVATSQAGLCAAGEQGFRLPRVEVRRHHTLNDFDRLFDRGRLRQLQVSEALKSTMRRACGLSNYLRLRSIAHKMRSPATSS